MTTKRLKQIINLLFWFILKLENRFDNELFNEAINFASITNEELKQIKEETK